MPPHQPPARHGATKSFASSNKNNNNNNKKKKAKQTTPEKQSSHRRPSVNRGPVPPVPPSPSPSQRFDEEVDPRRARHPSARGSPAQRPPHAPHPQHPRAPPHPHSHASRRTPKPKESPRALNYTQIRQRQAELYEAQKRRYAQLVAFHTQSSESSSADELPPGPPPSLDELRAQFHAEGLDRSPPGFEEAASHGADLPPSSLANLHESTWSDFELPPVPKTPKWRTRKPRRKQRMTPEMMQSIAAQGLAQERAAVKKEKTKTLER